MEGKEVRSDNFTWKVTQPVNSETENCVYMIECTKEKMETEIHRRIKKEPRKKIIRT